MVDPIKINIVNKDLQFNKVSLIEPTSNYYLHVAAEVDKSFFPFYLTTSNRKKLLIKQCKQFCTHIQAENNIVSAVVFEAIIIPPGQGEFIKQHKDEVHIARFDVVVLIEATTLEAINVVKGSSSFKQLEAAIKNESSFHHLITATNVKHISPVDHKKQGVFLFNYFYADNVQQNLDIWEYTAGWFQQETGLDNSTVLLPTDKHQSRYTIINHCRWDKLTDILPSLIFKKSFRSYVLDNFYSNKVAAMPVLYKLS